MEHRSYFPECFDAILTCITTNNLSDNKVRDRLKCLWKKGLMNIFPIEESA